MKALRDQRGFIPLVALGIGIALLGGGTVTASVANNSVPGEPMYGLDTAMESFMIATAMSDTSKAAAHLTIAQEKLSELQALEVKGKAAEHIAKAAEKLAEHQEAAGVKVADAKAQGKDVEAITQRLQENSARQQQVLMDVAARVPEQAQAAVQKAMEASAKGLSNAAAQQDKDGAAGDTPAPSEKGLENKPETTPGR